MAHNDHNQHFSGPVAQKVLIRKNGKILLVRYPVGDLAAGKLDMPGGRIHQGEKPIDGVLREVREEIGGIEWFDEREFFTLPIIYNEYKEALRSLLV